MKSSLSLEIFLLLLRSIAGEHCQVTKGVNVDHTGQVSTLLCQNPRFGIEYDQLSMHFTPSLFLRVLCSDDSPYVGLGDKRKTVFFCTESTCGLTKSARLYKHYRLYFNETVIRDIREDHIYYCYDGQWLPLMHGSTPEDLRNPSPITTTFSFKLWRKVSAISNSEETNDHNYNEDSTHQEYGHMVNNSELNIRYSKQAKNGPSDLCFIAIIFTIVCSVLFITTVVLLISTKFFVRQRIKDKLMTPIVNNIHQSESAVEELSKKLFPSRDQYVEISEPTTTCTATDNQPTAKKYTDIESLGH